MIRLITIISFVLLGFILHAKQVPIESVKTAAKNYLNTIKGTHIDELTFVKSQTFNHLQEGTVVSYYIFNLPDNNGFIVMSGDDVAKPVLGYTDSGSYIEDELPFELKKLLSLYNKEIKRLKAIDEINTNSNLAFDWQQLIRNNISTTKASVAPLLTTNWSQSTGGYNLYCPGNTPTGCVATATAQIMKYHNHPAQGSGSSSYNHNTYGTLAANFGSTTYNWTGMPNSLSGATVSQKQNVALLMYHIGVGLEMNYSPGNSGAFSHKVPDMLKDHFSYSSSVQYIKRSSYSLSSWKSLIKNDLNAARVVYHSGFCPDPQAGHAFVLDGYDDQDKFHVNWGWGGSSNGYFEINNLNPGSTYTFNDTQSAIINIVPLTQQTDVRMFGNMTLSTPSINMNMPLTLEVDVANYGNVTYSGSFRAAFFDLNNVYVGEVNTVSNQNILSNDYETLTFSTSSLTIPPGSYTLGVYYTDATNNYVLVQEDGFSNPLTVEINGTNPQGLVSNGNIQISPNPVQKDEPFQVEFEILNNSSSQFNGSISIDLHQLDGEWIDEVESGSYIINPQGVLTLVYNHTGLTQEPGTYKFILWHKPAGGSWEIIQDGLYPNNIAFDINGLSFANLPDSYENNNEVSLAYDVPVLFSNNLFDFTTSGANIHSVTLDSNDYYQLNLPQGASYEINARVHDSYNSALGAYSSDVIFRTSEDGLTWSEFIDDVELNMFTVDATSAQKTVYFHVVPFFYNELGSYELEVSIASENISSNLVGQLNKDVLLYPNPTNGIVTIPSDLQVDELTVYDYRGIKIANYKKLDKNSVDLSHLANGVYTVTILSSGKSIYEKLILTK